MNMTGRYYRSTFAPSIIFSVIEHDDETGYIIWKYINERGVGTTWYYGNTHELEDYQELSKLEMRLRGLDK